MRHIVRQTVRTRLVVAFVVAAVVPLVIFGALVSWRMGTSLRDAERREIAAQRRGAEAALQRRVSEERAFIHDYTVWDEFHAAISQGNQRWIRTNITGWVSETSPTKLVFLYDTAGHLIAHSDNRPAERLWMSDVAQAAAGRGLTSADLAIVGGDLYILAAAPVVAQTHPSRPNGVLVFGQAVTNPRHDPQQARGPHS